MSRHCCTELRESNRCIYNWNIPQNVILDSVLQMSASALFICPINRLFILYQISVVSQLATFSIDWRLLYFSVMSHQHKSCSPAAGSTIKNRFQFPCGHTQRGMRYSPAKAEECKVDAQQCGHHMPHKRTGLAGVQIKPEPHGREQGTELTYYKVHLKTKKHTKNTTDHQLNLCHNGQRLILRRDV